MIIVGKYKGSAQRLWIRDDMGSQFYVELDQHEAQVQFQIDPEAPEVIEQCTEYFVFEQDPDTQNLERIAVGSSKDGFTGAMQAAIDAIRKFEEVVKQAEEDDYAALIADYFNPETDEVEIVEGRVTTYNNDTLGQIVKEFSND